MLSRPAAAAAAAPSSISTHQYIEVAPPPSSSTQQQIDEMAPPESSVRPELTLVLEWAGPLVQQAFALAMLSEGWCSGGPCSARGQHSVGAHGQGYGG